MSAFPIFFIGHGGVNMLNKSDAQFDHYRAQLKEIGDEVKALKPKAIIAISGHFESPKTDEVLVNAERDPKIVFSYRFKHEKSWYEYTFNHHGNPEYSKEIEEQLKKSGIKSKESHAGTDHGIWVPGKLMFPEEKENEFKIPIISVSTFKATNKNFDQNVKLGEALASLRKKGYVILALGMIVHNLELSFDVAHDIPRSSKPYTSRGISNRHFEEDFDKEISSLLLNTPRDDRNNKIIHFEDGKDVIFNYSHPTFEHFTPFLTFIGAASDKDKAYVYPSNGYTEGMSYTNFRFAE